MPQESERRIRPQTKMTNILNDFSRLKHNLKLHMSESMILCIFLWQTTGRSNRLRIWLSVIWYPRFPLKVATNKDIISYWALFFIFVTTFTCKSVAQISKKLDSSENLWLTRIVQILSLMMPAPVRSFLQWQRTPTKDDSVPSEANIVVFLRLRFLGVMGERARSRIVQIIRACQDEQVKNLELDYRDWVAWPMTLLWEVMTHK